MKVSILATAALAATATSAARVARQLGTTSLVWNLQHLTSAVNDLVNAFRTSGPNLRDGTYNLWQVTVNGMYCSMTVPNNLDPRHLVGDITRVAQQAFNEVGAFGSIEVVTDEGNFYFSFTGLDALSQVCSATRAQGDALVARDQLPLVEQGQCQAVGN